MASMRPLYQSIMQIINFCQRFCLVFGAILLRLVDVHFPPITNGSSGVLKTLCQQFHPHSIPISPPFHPHSILIPPPFNPHFIPIPPLGQRMPYVARPWNYGCLPWLTPGPTDAFRSSPLELRMPSVAHPWSLRASGRHRTSHKTTLKTVWRRSSF